MLISLIIISISASTTNAATLADAFDFPFEQDGGTRPPWYTNYNTQNPYLTYVRPCYNKNLSVLQHAGEDWFRSAGTDVHATANGRVIFARNFNYPGAVVIIEHILDNNYITPWGNNIIYSVYSHLSTPPNSYLIPEGSNVSRGQVIGTVLDQASNSHLHFEMRRYGDMTNALICPSSGVSSWPGPGYTDTGVSPDTYGYTNPQVWIDSHRRGSTPPPSTPTLPPPPTTCAAINLRDPANGVTVSNRTVTFRWDAVNCGQSKYFLRIKTVPTMDSGGNDIANIPVTATDYTYTFDAQWDNRDLYWSVWPEVSGVSWTPARSIRISPSPPPSTCSAINLREPANGVTASSRTVTFRWDAVSCGQSTYALRVKTISNIEAGGETPVDMHVSGVEQTVTLDAGWENRDLYWSVIAEVSGTSWAPVQLFRISPTSPPSAPTGTFDAWPQSGGTPLSVAMHNTSTGSITSCVWDYGDGTTGSTSCAFLHEHIYTAPGTYTVSLTVTGPGGTQAQTRAGYITVASSSLPSPTVFIQAIDPTPPYCVLRTAAITTERELVLHGQGLKQSGTLLQFRNTATGATSIQFGSEINWESDSRITVDIGRIKQFLWIDPTLALVARITDGNNNFQPLSDWSAPFTLADNATTCGVSRPTSAALIEAVDPPVPYCVLRSAPTTSERQLELRGRGFKTPGTHVQFLNTVTNERSLNFGMEINWESDTRVTVDLAQIKRNLWITPKLTLVARITDGTNNYQPISDWSAPFFIADDATTCGISRLTNQAPPIPTVSSPGDWYETSNGSAPTLCWGNASDPNGDPVAYYAEVYQGAVTTNSGWTTATCWRPTTLDGQYNEYQWHLKARDSQGSESAWSTPQHFTLRIPTAPLPTLRYSLFIPILQR